MNYTLLVYDIVWNSDLCNNVVQFITDSMLVLV